MIRRAEPEDAEAIGETFALSFETLLSFLPDLHTSEERRRYMIDVVARSHEMWMAEADGCVVGLAALGESELAHLYVHPDHVGRGIGSRLLEKTMELRPEGFTLWTFPANERACRLLREAPSARRAARRRVGQRGRTAGRAVRVAAGRYAVARSCRPRIERAMTRRWISLVPS